MDTLQNTENLARRIQRLEDVEAIKQLKARYALGCDAKNNVDMKYLESMLMPLFAEGAVIDIERFGRHSGLPAIREYYRKSHVSWTFHCMISPVVEVADDGRTARGTWYLWELANIPNAQTKEPESFWIGGTYDDEFLKVDGQWKFTNVRLKIELLCPYASGSVTKFIGIREKQ